MTDRGSAAATIALAILVIGPMPRASAHTFRVGPIVVDHPWTRQVPVLAKARAGHMVITNEGSADDRLIAATSPEATAVIVYGTEAKDGVDRMLRQEEGVTIPAHSSVWLKPGGYYLLLSGLRGPLPFAHKIPLTLSLKGARTMPIELEMEQATGMPSGHQLHKPEQTGPNIDAD